MLTEMTSSGGCGGGLYSGGDFSLNENPACLCCVVPHSGRDKIVIGRRRHDSGGLLAQVGRVGPDRGWHVDLRRRHLEAWDLRRHDEWVLLLNCRLWIHDSRLRVWHPMVHRICRCRVKRPYRGRHGRRGKQAGLQLVLVGVWQRLYR